MGGRNTMRRLYDIINVFKAFGLIQKQKCNDKKNENVWRGL